MRRPFAGCVLVGLLVVGATASAQDPAAPSGNYGGGLVALPPAPIVSAGNMLVGLRVTGAQVQVNASMGASCATAALRAATARIEAGGVFKARGSGRAHLGTGRLATTRYEIDGTITGATASGTASSATTITGRRRRASRCSSGTVMWGARRSNGDIGAPGVAPDARMYGTTTQRLGGPRRAIVLRASADGSKLARALYDVTLRCAGGRTITDIYDAPRRNLTIASDGTFSDVERFTLREANATVRFTERFSGTIGAAGASGTLSTQERSVSRRTGRSTGSCSSGTVRWSAAP